MIVIVIVNWAIFLTKISIFVNIFVFLVKLFQFLVKIFIKKIFFFGQNLAIFLLHSSKLVLNLSKFWFFKVQILVFLVKIISVFGLKNWQNFGFLIKICQNFRLIVQNVRILVFLVKIWQYFCFIVINLSKFWFFKVQILVFLVKIIPVFGLKNWQNFGFLIKICQKFRLTVQNVRILVLQVKYWFFNVKILVSRLKTHKKFRKKFYRINFGSNKKMW